MKQIWITRHAGTEKLTLRESQDPQPQGNEIRIRVKASGINFADILARLGLYPDAPKPPMVVGYEISGTVDAVGPRVRHHWMREDVFGLARLGAYSDVVVFPQDQAFQKPAALSHEQTARAEVSASPGGLNSGIPQAELEHSQPGVCPATTLQKLHPGYRRQRVARGHRRS